jgi:DNA mismatch repair protein MutS2
MISENALRLLEFHKLLKIISKYSHSEATEKAVLHILPMDVREDIETRFSQVGEIRRMSQQGDRLRFSHFSDISPLLVRVRPEGAVLDSKELSLFIPFFSVLSVISSQMRESVDMPFLGTLTGTLSGFPEILRILERSVDGNGNILDSASSLLSRLRGQVRQLEGKVQKKLEELIREERFSAFLQDTFITERSGRWVIPVRMDSKGMVPGVVHDISRSGETAFVEPLAIIGLSNELENVIAEKKAEEIRILRDISSKIRGAADEIDVQYRIIVYLDLLNCVAEFADQLRMQTPELSDSGVIDLVEARHPLLFIALRNSASTQDVVPLSVQLGGENRVMVITGSNAGGKTIAIKTIGLLVLMALSGMPVPADSSSSFPLARDILIDIGDEQSIENSLSTFSAHMTNVSKILEKAGPESIVLIDELGTGTDPEEGAALACAVLKEIRDKGALLFATTHLTDIKGFVHRTEGMANASMEFDQESLTPLYRLRVGEPGQSHAIEIARRYGLPERIVSSAKALLGGARVELDKLIIDLNEKRKSYERGLLELEKRRTETEEREKAVREKLDGADGLHKEILARAYREASEIIGDTRRKMNALINEITKRDKAGKREAAKQLQAKEEEVIRKIREYDVSDAGAPPIGEIRKGDILFISSLGYDASVIGVDEKNNRVRVEAGGKEIEADATDIRFRRGKSPETKKGSVHVEKIDDSVSARLNLVGMRVDEALSRLEPFLNHASLAGLREVTIVHGFGAGILLRAVREHLTGHPLIMSFRSGEQSEGGAGVTIATLA